MVVLSSVLMATSLMGLSHAAPAKRSAEEGTFVPAIGYGTEPEGSFREAVAMPTPEILELTQDEFLAWAGNASADATEMIFKDDANSIEERGTVILPDERYYQSSSALPYSTMGRLYMPLGNGVYSWCTGTLVGPRLMAAARHCINSAAQYYEFSPGYRDGNVFPTAQVTKIVYLVKDSSIGNCDLMNDWALYVLNQPLGTSRGYLNIGSYISAESAISGKKALSSAGYPGDLSGGQRLYMTDDRKTSRSLKDSCANGGPITGDADVAGGMSGGPLWIKVDGVRWNYGTLFGAFIDGNGNELQSIHAHGPQLIQTVNQLNKENPA